MEITTNSAGRQVREVPPLGAATMIDEPAGASSLIYLDETRRLLDNCDEAERVVETEACRAS